MIGFGMRDKCKIVVNKDAEISKGNMFKVLVCKQILVGEIDAFSQNICKHDTQHNFSEVNLNCHMSLQSIVVICLFLCSHLPLFFFFSIFCHFILSYVFFQTHLISSFSFISI